MFIQTILGYFNSINKNSDIENTELEIKVLLDPRINSPNFIKSQSSVIDDFKYIDMIKKIINGSINFGHSSISQTINFIQTEQNQMFVKQLHFKNGIQIKEKRKFYVKKSLLKPVYLISNEINQPAYKLSISNESYKEEDVNNFDIIRFRLRYTIEFVKPELKNWKLELTLVKECKNIPLSQIKMIRDRLFKQNIDCNNFLDAVDWKYSDRIELEMEYIGLDAIQLSDIKSLDELWKPLQSHNKTYSECINQIAQIIKPNIIDKFKSGYFGLKQLGTNPVELTKKYFHSNILPNINDFILTEKIDGTRSMIIIYPKLGLCHIINKTYKYIQIPIVKNEKINLIILDAEEYKNNETKNSLIEEVYYVFDCIWYDKDVFNLPFSSMGLDKTNMNFKSTSDRLNYIKKAVDKYDFLKLKHFIHLNTSEFPRQIKQLQTDLDISNNDSSKNIPATDGFIFISKYDNYNDTKNYKWKPIEKMTIDFVVKKCPSSMLGIYPYITKDKKTLYILFSGIRSNEYKKLGIQKFKSYDNMFKQVHYKDTYFPIQFSPSSDPYAYLFWSDNHDLDNNIVELSRADNEWKLFKIRNDRKIDMDRKTYYGNYFKYAEYIWMNYSNPLTMEYLCNPTSNINEYFQNDDNNLYKYTRKFNNFVKNALIQMYAENNSNWVIDLACGKAQDLFKYTDCGIKNILMIDIDISALTEVIHRKYTYINNKHSSISNIFIKQLDLSESYKKNIDIICEPPFRILNNGVPLVICNFALHYLIPNKSKIQNFCNLLNKLLEPGGIFMFTSFNSKKVFELLKGTEAWNRYKDEKLIFSIKKKYTDDVFTGLNQKIDVLLPFSNGLYYTEYLINEELLERELAKKKIVLINKDSFDIYMDKFKKTKPHFYKELTDIDNEYISLYNFYVFNKQKSR